MLGAPPQLLIKKLSYRFAYNPILWRRFLKRGSLLLEESNSFQVHIKLARTHSTAVSLLPALQTDSIDLRCLLLS